MKIGKTRSLLYKTARGLGDFQAISSGSPRRIARRVLRRGAGRVTARGLGRLFR